jgi:hypothetical protein
MRTQIPTKKNLDNFFLSEEELQTKIKPLINDVKTKTAINNLIVLTDDSGVNVGDLVLVDSLKTITITLPSGGLQEGDRVIIKDLSHTASFYPVIIKGEYLKIPEGELIADVDGFFLDLVIVNNKWVVVQ